MLSPRQLMDQALKAHVVPALRERGFTGSFPHFRRLRTDRIDLLTFQFERNGGGFVIETAHCGIEGVTLHSGKHVPATKVTAWDLHPDMRTRVKPSHGSGTDSWFRFATGDYREVANQVLLKLSGSLDYENKPNGP